MAKPTKGQGWELISAKREAVPEAELSEAPQRQRILLREEGRSKGKVVTVARGFKLRLEDLDALLRDLKARCGSGGCRGAEPGVIEIQGRQRDKLRELLEGKGYQTA